MEDDNSKFLTIAEVAKLLKVSKGTARRWAHEGLLGGVCLLPAGKRQKLRVKQETIYDLWIEGIVQEELERAYREEEEAEYAEHCKHRDAALYAAYDEHPIDGQGVRYRLDS